VQGGVTIGGLYIESLTRCIVEFETPRDATSEIQFISMGSSFGSTVDDLLIDGVRTFDDGPTNTTGITLHGRRVALINSNLLASSYGLWSDQGSSGRPTNVIVYNNIVDAGNYSGGTGPQSLVRMTGSERTIICRNRLVKHNTGLMIRIYNKSDFWFSHNQIEAADYASVSNDGSVIDTRNAGDSGTAVNTSNGIHFRDNTNYNDTSMLNIGSCGGEGLAVTVRDNVEYGGNSSSYSTGTPTGFTFTNNTDEVYEAPPSWDFA
jgi:hypothetical protein